MNNSVLFRVLFILSILFLIITGCSRSRDSKKIDTKQSSRPAQKVLLVNSYSQDYFWTRGITEAIENTMGVAGDESGPIRRPDGSLVMEIIDMDTKSNPSEDYIQTEALQVRDRINSWKPDVVITSDDNAAKYVIVPYFKNTDTPFVFCGINWDASEYGFPCSNVTGMLEVQLIDRIISTLKEYSRGDRIAFLKGDDFSARKEAQFFEERFGITLIKRFVKNFEEWKIQYKKLQDEADILLLGNTISIPDWNSDLAGDLVDSDITVIPSGNWDEPMAAFSLVTYATKAEEQGDWAAEAALKILSGTKPDQIPVATNVKAKIIINMGLARKLKILFPAELLDQAFLIQ